MENPEMMTPRERRTVASLASIYALRMLGLFMILPVFALYAEHLEGVTPTLIGVAIGAYGLTQAILQIPFGTLSDRIGRKPVIIGGLLIFAAGSAVAAVSDSIFGVILGRCLQGAGAISAVVMALVSDLTREEHRTKAMAVIGTSIGFSFALSLLLGPILGEWIGVKGIFWLIAVLALLGIAVIVLAVPTPQVSRRHRDAVPVPKLIREVLADRQLLRLDIGVMALHMVLTAMFVVLPLVLRDKAGLPVAEHWKIYLPVLLGSLVLMVPFVIIAEKRRKLRSIFIGAIFMLTVSLLVFTLWRSTVADVVIALLVLFTAFNILEATLPSLVAKMVMPDRKGTAMGIFSTAQFFGAFVGGSMGGWLHGQFGISAVFAFCGLVGAVWLLVASTMQSPRYLTSYILRVGPVDEARSQELINSLTAVRGVAEVQVIPEDEVAYLKVDKHALDHEALQRFSVPART